MNLDVPAWGVGLCAAIPAAVLGLECLVGSWPGRAPSSRHASAPVPPFIVLMPAHDEAGGIAPVVSAVLVQLRPCDELIVIADNCADQTAAIARDLGATVIERLDHARRGKGHALEFGRAHIERDRVTHLATVIVIVDADCLAQATALQPLVAACARRGAVVQGAYLMTLPPEADAIVRVSCFAFLVKNLVRQLALDRLAGSALLQGSGMAFPRTVFARMRWETDSLVEDLDMGLDLLLAGDRVVFEPRAVFRSEASSAQGTAGQRRRWEHGMLESVSRQVPRLLAAGLRGMAKGQGRLLVVALDLMVPPTVMLVLLLLAATPVVFLLSGPSWPLWMLLAAQFLLLLGLGSAWWRHGREVLPVASLLEVPRYVLWKLPLLAQFVTRRERDWVRTERRP